MLFDLQLNLPVILTSHLYIATAAGCMTLSTFFLLKGKLEIQPLVFLVFFATIIAYDFHQFSSFLAGKKISISFILNRLRGFSTTTKTKLAISGIGILVTAFFLQTKTVSFIVLPAFITLAYSIPVLRINGKQKRLREFFLVKITVLSLAWCFMTATLPMIESNVSIFSISSLFIFAERFVFMFAICIPFEIRDMEIEKKKGINTFILKYLNFEIKILV